MCHVGNTAMWTPSIKRGTAGNKNRGLFFQSQLAHFQRRIVERAWAKPRQHVIFPQHRIIALLRGLQLNLISVSSMPLPNAKYLVQTNRLGIGTAESVNFLSIEGVT
jgi:hypothetical protein